MIFRSIRVIVTHDCGKQHGKKPNVKHRMMLDLGRILP